MPSHNVYTNILVKDVRVLSYLGRPEYSVSAEGSLLNFWPVIDQQTQKVVGLNF